MPAAARSNRVALWAGFALGLLVELPALLAAMASGGAGHGHYVFARAAFPLPMFLTVFQGDSIGPLSIASALLQFPVYGALLGWSHTRRKYLPAAIVASVHILAAIGCFTGSVPNFS